ncbi:PLP-dependent aminotransferase family protein [Aurantiacibacter xanthus]|uniref:PLP-dependent aminotransferase family protein n=1 Tax=Aurantiacibacter xanthus TaxID=1784712 RepID=A0A3A1P9R7_9SPHN|nr:PLP-dependent aminotransferase family protein [Aurantiacibacter xanthus]RIV89721.1 PLP-dependent aminotransferase family protein [Aurantiacibacter xanthus]
MTTQVPWQTCELTLDRAGPATLVDQIAGHIEAAIAQRVLPPGARLPSWRDLASQLGVARGTVRAAYEKLIDRGLLHAAGSAGTRVVARLPAGLHAVAADGAGLLPEDYHFRSGSALVFQMGVPAHDAFPATLWARLHRQAVQATSLQSAYSDPRGLPELRAAIASHLAIARGITCSPEQVIVTSGYRDGLGIALRAIGAGGKQAWIEDPGYPVTRFALELSGIHPVAVPVDDAGLVVERGCELAPHAALAIVTPGQQAPRGVLLAPHRRQALIAWAARNRSWIIEDDYLAELHLAGRSPDAMAADEGAERVIHIGTFSKTIAPMVGIGFLVAPLPLARRLIDVATWLTAPPNPAAQCALVSFLREGHYLRHLRRMRRLYGQRRERLLQTLAGLGVEQAAPAALSVLLPLPDGFDDQHLARAARAHGLGPAPLSPWFAGASQPRSGLMLAVANVRERQVEQDCRRLLGMIDGALRQDGRLYEVAVGRQKPG